MTGTTQGQVHQTFRDRIEALRAAARQMASAFTGSDTRPWQTPVDSNLANVQQLAGSAFDRDAINANYLDAMKSAENPGTIGDIVGVKAQVDYVAAEERAFRTRHSSPCRALAHAAGRRHGHGNGPVFTLVERQIGNTITAGGLQQEPPDGSVAV